jgi:hypothetical protein
MKRGKWIGWTAAAVAGAGLFAGVANAAESGSSTPTAAKSNTSAYTRAATTNQATGLSADAVRRLKRKLAAGAVRGEIVLNTKQGFQTVDFQRGSVSDASSSGFTVTDTSGTAENWAVSSDTKVRERGTTSAQITNGENVLVIGLKTDGTPTARLVVIAAAKSSLPQPTA